MDSVVFFLSFFLIMSPFYLLVCVEGWLSNSITLNGTHAHTHTHTHTHTHIHELSRTPLDEGSGRRRPDNTQHSQETDMPSAGFEPETPESERPQTYALDCAATGIG